VKVFTMKRRWFLTAGAASLVAGHGLARSAESTVRDRLAGIVSRVGGRVGVHWYDTHTGARIGLDDESRYAMASTFKMLLAAAVLSKVDRGELALATKLPFGEKEMLPTAPVSLKYLAEGAIPIQAACAAVVEVSDNTAANLLLKQIGGPEGFTKFVRQIGDNTTRLDRFELELNTNEPGDPRDTTTPKAMVGSMEQVLMKDVLSAVSRQRLTDWLISATPGLTRIRAGLPSDWKAGDKTGTGRNGAVNDLAILWPPGRKPILVAIYLSESKKPNDELIAAHAEIARLLATTV
jgi:beta-lactamase class A